MSGAVRTAFAALAASAALLAGADDMAVAREALRDGLWDVARARASMVGGDEAALVVLESYAREGRWDDVLTSLDAAGDPENPGFSYYRALALYETGRRGESAAVMESNSFSNTVYDAAAARLRARAALDSGDSALALRISRESGFAGADVDSRMAAAEILLSSGDAGGAEAIWRGVASDTNAPGRASVAAAANLGDASLLRKAYAHSKEAPLSRIAGLRLGRILIGEPKTFAEGTNLICTIAGDAPDAEGAREAYVAMADALLSAEEWQAAADAYRRALESWPAAAFDAQVQEGRGWALRRLGRTEEAIDAYARAEECATNDEAKASASLARGDALAEAGRGEEAMTLYRSALSRYPKTAAGERLGRIVKMREMESAARDLYKEYRFGEAQARFAEIAALDPDSAPRMEFCEVLCLYGQRRDREALEKARSVAHESPDLSVRADATLWLAKYAYNARRWGESRALFAAYATNMAPSSVQAPSALLWAGRAAMGADEYQEAVDLASRLAKDYPGASEVASGYLLQGEALIELARFDEAVLVLERAVLSDGASAEDRLRAQVLKADALFAMGADNPARYRAALDAYRAVRLGESLPPGLRIEVSFKIARTLEKLRRLDEAIDEYYAEVVLAYRNARLSGARLDDDVRAVFVRAAFRLADEYESRGMDFQAVRVLELVVASDAPAAEEAARRIGRMQMKGKFL